MRTALDRALFYRRDDISYEIMDMRLINYDLVNIVNII